MNGTYQERIQRTGGSPNRQKSLRQRKRRRRRRFFRRCIRLAAALAVLMIGIRLITAAVMPGAERFELMEKGKNLLAILRENNAWQQESYGQQQEAYDRQQKANNQNRDSQWEQQDARKQTEVPREMPQVDLNGLYSPYAVLADLESGEVLAAHNGQERIYPASLTKIMTALIAIENLPDLEETVKLPTEMFRMLYIRHASLAGFEPEEQVQVKDLLYGILLPSGAECCIACAERIAGSEEAFVELMNEKAQELGMKDTHFTNSTGLHETDHVSTAADIERLVQYALLNDVFREIFTCKSHTTGATAAHPEGLTFENTMFHELDSDLVTSGRILGGKTGYTSEAGLCLASFAEIGGRGYVLVTAKAAGSHQTEPFHVLDAVNVYEQIGAAEAGR